jgi:DNA polymerase-3 subunit gamma/tau
MSYLVFARKWRPQTFEEIVGQEHVTTTLKNAILSNRVAHAYLFSGPRGVGKTTTARIFAKALNCQSGDKPTATPCNKCESCIEVAEGRSLDVIEIDGASNRGIDEIRQLRENVKFGPSKGRYKVYIIDEVHQITQDGFNALLKTLEEPPKHVKFVFATTHRHKVMPTILSRCQRFDFKRVPTLKLADKLKSIAKSEKINIDEEALFAISRAADGSVRDAESILDQLASFSRQSIKAEDVISLLGGIEQETLFQAAQLIVEKNSSEAIKLVDAFIDNGKDPLQFMQGLLEHFRNLAVAKIESSPADLIDLPKEIVEKIVKQAQQFNLVEILYIFNALNNTHDLMRKSGLARIQLEILLVRLTNRNLIREEPKVVLEKPPKYSAPLVFKAEPSVSPREAVLAEAKVSVALKESPVPGDNIQAKSSGKVLISIDEIRNLWPELLSRVKTEKISAALFLLEGKPDFIDGLTLNINFPSQFVFYKEALERMENRDIIERYLKEIFNQDIKIKLNIADIIQGPGSEKDFNPAGAPPDPDAPSGRIASQKAVVDAQAAQKTPDKGSASSEIIVKSALGIFRGRIVRKQ